MRPKAVYFLSVVLLTLALTFAIAISPGSQASPLAAKETETLDYLSDIGFGAEYGTHDELLHRWAGEIRVEIKGEPTDVDLDTVEGIVTELDPMLGQTNILVSNQNSNLSIYFVPQEEFLRIEPSYVEGNLGFFGVWYGEDGEITGGRILIASEGITQSERNHLIREELTQSLGLFRDSWRFSDSVFYQGWTNTSRYSPLDISVIELHYSADLKPGMSQREVQRAITVDHERQHNPPQ